VVQSCPAMLPSCGHAIVCEVGLSSYGVHLSSMRATMLVDGRSIVKASGQVT
jgi:hypothetical protein